MTEAGDHVLACRQIRDDLTGRFGLDLDALRNEGLLRAEQFRRELIAQQNDRRVAEQVVRFVRLVRDGELLAGRPGVAGFAGLTATGIADAIRGRGQKGLDGEAAFGRFTGRWFGRWETMKVDHAWDAIDHDPPAFGTDDHPRPISMQFAWVGEAFCWHTVAACPDRPEHRVILGTVYHIRNDRIGEPVPHVAVAAPGGRLVWITPQNVFLEEVTPDQRYAITGFAYAVTAAGASFKDGRGFQAVYTRSPEKRPPFFTFRLSR